MNFVEYSLHANNAISLSQFKDMDFYTVENFNLPLELMMENAGFHLARLVVSAIKNPGNRILIGIGNGNNGGGGLVAARRLTAWGFDVYLDILTDIKRVLPRIQLERAKKFGVKTSLPSSNPDVWVDAYLGFSQRLPLQTDLLQKIKKANDTHCIRIALDLPTGFIGNTNDPHFKAHRVLSLAALKKPLLNLSNDTIIYLADLGIPKEVYQKYGIEYPIFQKDPLVKISII